MGSSVRSPPRSPQEIFPAPALSLSLSLSLAGPFSRTEEPAAATRVHEVEDEGNDGIRGDGLWRPGEAAEINSENTGQGSRSGGAWSREEACHEDARANKTEHEQIKLLEAAFKESPHPDEKQRQQLSEQLGLSASGVKYWFQNRRFQVKVIQERQENSRLKPQLLKLQEQNRVAREFIKNSSRSPTPGIAAVTNTEEQLLRLENAKLKAEVERLRRALGDKNKAAALPTSPSCSTGGIQVGIRNSPEDDEKKKKFLELAGRALDELTTMCSSGEPLWVRSVETGRDVLNYDEYARLFRRHDDDSGDQGGAVWSVEASRETGIVHIDGDATKLVGAFVDVKQWKEMFPTIITKASTLQVIHAGNNDHRDGVVQLMSAEVQTLTPLVPTRELHFLRHCKKLGADTKWAIVDVSLDNFEPGARTQAPSSSTTTPCMCLKKPSGCIVEELSCGRCKVTWVEHVKCREAAVPSMYRAVTTSGTAFGARRWVAALALQCERMVFSVATNIPTRGRNGVQDLSGRQGVLKVAQRMTWSICRAIAASRDPAWRKASSRGGTHHLRMASWKNATAGEHGEPQGLIACAVLSSWLPVTPAALFAFLLDESRRHEWDFLMPGNSAESHVTVRKGNDPGNCVTAYVVKSSGKVVRNKWVIEDSSTSGCESTVVYVPVDAAVLRPVIYGGQDSNGATVLPCGIVVMPDGQDQARPAAITSSRKGKEVGRSTAVECPGGGSLVTLAFQTQASSSATDDAALATEATKEVTRLVCSTLGQIKKALRLKSKKRKR